MSGTEKWSQERIERASRLWAGRMPADDIARIMGVSPSAFSWVTTRYRNMFPLRQKPKYTLPSDLKASAVQPRPGDRQWSRIGDRRVERVPYTTFAGAVVSLPRVSILNGKEA